MLERAVLFCGTDNKMLNSALIAGSSQQGKHLLASVASNCVTAEYFSSPLGLQTKIHMALIEYSYHIRQSSVRCVTHSNRYIKYSFQFWFIPTREHSTCMSCTQHANSRVEFNLIAAFIHTMQFF